MTNREGVFRSGTSGLVLSEPNKKYYPKEFQEKTRLSYYSSKFNTIEINSSFYKIPRCQTYRNWSQQVPEDFQFSIKLWKGITHSREFSVDKKDIDSFFSAINCLGNKKGCLLLQFPAGTLMTIEQFGNILKQIRYMDPGRQWRLAVEFRHLRWYENRVLNLIEDEDATLVLHDMPGSGIGQIVGKPSWVYLRFHGEKGDYKGSYSYEHLHNRAIEIKNWLSQGLDVYAYFNNTIGSAADNLEMLNLIVNNLW